MGILDAYFLGRPCTCEQQRQDFTDLAVDTERSKRERRFMGGMIACFRDGLCIFLGPMGLGGPPSLYFLLLRRPYMPDDIWNAELWTFDSF